MSTRCMINFCERGEVQAKTYRHSDGYPDGPNGVLACLQRFYCAVRRSTADHRFRDAEYLAVKWLVWATGQYVRSMREMRKRFAGMGKGEKHGRLDFLGYGVSMQDHSDVEYLYYVHCDKLDAKGHPTITFTDSAGNQVTEEQD